MKIIQPEFKDDQDKIIAIIMAVTTLFFSFIPSLIVVLLLKNMVSEGTYNISKAFLNLELLLFLILLVCGVPILGWLLGIIIIPIVSIFNAVVVIIALCSMFKGKEVKIPVGYEFI